MSYALREHFHSLLSTNPALTSVSVVGWTVHRGMRTVVILISVKLRFNYDINLVETSSHNCTVPATVYAKG